MTLSDAEKEACRTDIMSKIHDGTVSLVTASVTCINSNTAADYDNVTVISTSAGTNECPSGTALQDLLAQGQQCCK